MIKNYLLITWRSMMKNKLYIFINIFGMAISIACCIVAYYNYDFNSSFDSNHVNASTIYRVNSVREFQNQQTEFGIAPIPLGEVIRQNAKDVDAVTRYSPSGGNIRIGDEIFETGIAYVDADFFKMFTFEFIEGNGSGVSDRSKIVISEELRTKFFGSEKALGKVITQILDNNQFKEYEIAGVYKKPPSNNSFDYDAHANYDNYLEQDSVFEHGTNWKYRNQTFVQVKDASRIGSLESQLKSYAENNNKVREDFIIKGFKLDPLVGMATRDESSDRPGTWTRDASPIAAVVGTALMGILVLLIACFNLTNTAVAISSRRLKEIGIRKVMGSMRSQLIVQFIGETMFVCFIALILGMVIADILLIPAFNALWPEMKLIADYTSKPDFLIFMIIALAFTGLLAGSYPAFYISKFQPTSILKGKLKFGGTNIFTMVLLTLQFAISLTGIVCSIAFSQNAEYQANFDTGFDQKGVVYTWVANQSEFDTYRNALAENPEIISIAGSEHHIYSSAYNDPIKSEGKEIEVDILDVGDDYLKTVGIKLVDGRDFKKDSETDRKESVIITQKVARDFGWDKPIGKEITWMDTVKLYVVGVIEDVYNNGLWEQMDPMMIRYTSPDRYRHVIVNAPAAKIVEINKFMEAKWKEVFPNKKYNSEYMDEEIVEATTVNVNIVKMFVFLGIVAMMLSATGLFTMVSLNIIKKMKEIGVRKVLGASMVNITRVINLRFIVILSIASLLGSALGAFLSDALMDSIWDFYQSAGLITFIVSVAILFVVSALSIGYKVYSTARLNPALVLRDE
ncbi:MAG: ABC transporter permease [Bacteroidota bacterium]